MRHSSKIISERKRIEELKDKLRAASTMLLVQARYFHHTAKNHTGGFGDCGAPVCKIAREFNVFAEIDVAKEFAAKEACWLAEIKRLDKALTAATAEQEKK